ncbi:MAG: hypothetical protein ABIW76_06415 [Fibrobacteria bacterium]
MAVATQLGTAWGQSPAAADTSARLDTAVSRLDTSAITADPLLPEVMSPGERIMWGEHGLMRITGIYPLSEESREKEFGLRRTMLTVHQMAGFATLAAMIATATYGQLTLNGYTSLGETHQTLADITIGSYFFTAAMSLLSPPPAIRRKEWNTISIHKGLAIVHFTGMVVTPLLADGIAYRNPGASQETIDRDKAQVHQISGYITTATFAAAMMVVTF